MIYAALTLLIVLQAIDLWTTSKFRRGSEQEANPFARWIWRRFGFGAIIAGKVAITVAVAAFVIAYPDEPVSGVVLAIGLLAVGWVAASNIRAMRRRR